MKTINLFPLVVATLFFATSAHAITIDLVTIGNPGNAPDTRYDATGFGSVGHSYQIGKYEVTAGQYTEFLNAVADTDTYGLYNGAMGDPATDYSANIQRTGGPGSYRYGVAADWANRPVNYVSVWDAARFANWLHNGQPTTGVQDNTTTEDGAYDLDGYTGFDGTSIVRKPNARFFVPSEDEWHKAAYHDKTAGLAASYFDYPTGTNAVPGHDITETTNPGNNANSYINNYVIGSPYYRTVVGEFELSDSPYGTFDQGGNVWEWNETVMVFSRRGLRGGSFESGSNAMLASIREHRNPPLETYWLGFRVASIPEPGGITLCVVGVMTLILWRRKK